MVPKPVDRPRPTAVALVVEPQAQSIAPVTPGASKAFWTLGVKMSVLPCASVGRPEIAPALVTDTAPEGLPAAD